MARCRRQSTPLPRLVALPAAATMRRMPAARSASGDESRAELAGIAAGLRRAGTRARRMGRAPRRREPGPPARSGGEDLAPATTRADVAEQAARCGDLRSLARAVSQCRACALCETR